jgi:hypothetical protein
LISKSILRKFFSIEEQNNWFAASDKRPSSFLGLNLKQYPGIDSPYGYGEVYKRAMWIQPYF